MELIHLSAADLHRLQPTAVAAADAVEHAYRLHAQGRAYVKPKLTLSVVPGHFFQALACTVDEPPWAVCKWVGVVGANAQRGLASVNGLVLLSDLQTGLPAAILDAAVLTAVRTAATTAVAARYLARPDSRVVGFIGTGVQARSHLAMLPEFFPEFREVRLMAGRGGADELCRQAQSLGLRVVTSDNWQDVVAGSDIIISTVPGSDMLSPFLDAGMLAPGSFVSAVDLGRSWHGESFTDLDLICTDDHTQSKEQKALGKLNNPRPFDADLGDLCGRKHPGRTTAQQRCIFMFPGFALSDLALAVLYYRAAIAGKVGQVLRR